MPLPVRFHWNCQSAFDICEHWWVKWVALLFIERTIIKGKLKENDIISIEPLISRTNLALTPAPAFPLEKYRNRVFVYQALICSLIIISCECPMYRQLCLIQFRQKSGLHISRLSRVVCTQVKVHGLVQHRNGTVFDPSIYRHFMAWKPLMDPFYLRACHNGPVITGPLRACNRLVIMGSEPVSGPSK